MQIDDIPNSADPKIMLTIQKKDNSDLIDEVCLLLCISAPEEEYESLIVTVEVFDDSIC